MGGANDAKLKTGYQRNDIQVFESRASVIGLMRGNGGRSALQSGWYREDFVPDCKRSIFLLVLSNLK